VRHAAPCSFKARTTENLTRPSSPDRLGKLFVPNEDGDKSVQILESLVSDVEPFSVILEVLEEIWTATSTLDRLPLFPPSRLWEEVSKQSTCPTLIETSWPKTSARDFESDRMRRGKTLANARGTFVQHSPQVPLTGTPFSFRIAMRCFCLAGERRTHRLSCRGTFVIVYQAKGTKGRKGFLL
jgi:hypothetical protein